MPPQARCIVSANSRSKKLRKSLDIQNIEEISSKKQYKSSGKRVAFDQFGEPINENKEKKDDTAAEPFKNPFQVKPGMDPTAKFEHG